MSGSEYVPAGPYFIRSGKRIGKSLEELMFEEYSVLVAMRSKITVASNDMQKHLVWLMDRGEDRVANAACPYCQNRATHFVHRYDFRERYDEYFASCNIDDRKSPNYLTCRGQILSRVGRLDGRSKCLSLKFSSIMQLSVFARSNPEVGKFFGRMYFPGCEVLTAQQLFEFFSAPSPRS